jgi:hypothetical protein
VSAPLAGALSALTAVQTSAAQMLAARPDGVVFAIPLVTEHGSCSARITVQREAPRRPGVPLDGANFHVAFVLETAHYGTVAIDLVTVGREVSIDVRARDGAAVRAFRDALDGLVTRLDALRYRVVSAAAAVAPRSNAAASAPAPAARDGSVDRSA